VALHSIRAAVEFALLGPLVVHHGGHAVALAGAKERGVLAFLLLRANEVVPAERLIDALWPDDPPSTARNSLQVRISHLRKVLGADRIETVRNGYKLIVSRRELDLLRFRRLVSDARQARDDGDVLGAAERLADGLALWRGGVLPEFSSNPEFRTEIGSVEDERLRAFEAWADAELDLGRAGELVPELEAAVAANPLRERLMGQLMLALYRAGRQAEALELYSGARRRLVDELGLEPGPMLADLHQRILAQDAELIPAPPPTKPSAPSRRNLTIVLGVVAAPDGDPEVVERSLADARRRARSVLEEQDAVVSETSATLVAAFGIPAAREDDPHRALRAAEELAEQGLRVGVDTGVALAVDSELVDARFVARLNGLIESAGSGDVILGAGARAALGDAVEVSGSRLVSFDPDAEPIARHYDAPLIGRDPEFERLRGSFDWTVRNRRSHLVTVLGPAGIGKSRLARELTATVAGQATILNGRCLAYGSSAFWPLAEMVKQAAGDTRPTDLLQLLEGLEDRGAVVDQLAAALGTGSGMSAEDAFWAFRKLFGALAADRPLVLAFEDLHWAEERLLDFIEELVERSEGVPILVLCLARPDLLDQRPSWGGGKLDAESTQLGPLSEASSEELIRILGGSVSDDARLRIAMRAEGNPLFIEQLVALASDEPEAPADAIPFSIHAVLAARIDRLAQEERELLGCASIIGLEFSLSGVAPLSSEDVSDEALSAMARRLVRKDLLRPAGPEICGRGDYRFRHILIRDVVYGTVLKATRAELHERFARWLERDLQERADEVDEIIGYHLERSYELRKELDPAADGLDALAEEAGERLAVAGRRQLDRSDMHAATELL
jgi:DNA-binding SARP family transcriptional activator